MERSDDMLIEAHLAGDEDAFAELVGRHLRGVYSFAARSVARDADDLVQEIFLKAWRGLRSYDRSQARFRTWLMRIARNTVIDSLRKKTSTVFTDLGTEEQPFEARDPEPLPDELAAKTHDARAARRALDALSPLYREVLLLRYMEQMTFEEIASILDESANTVRSRHRRALAQLRSDLAALHRN